MDAALDRTGAFSAARPRNLAQEAGMVRRGMGMPDGADGAVGGCSFAGKGREHPGEFAISVGEHRGSRRVSGATCVGDFAKEEPGRASANDDPGDDLTG